MSLTRNQKRKREDIDTPSDIQSTKERKKLKMFQPLFTLVKKEGIDVSYGWELVSFYYKNQKISSYKLIKCEVDITCNIARYNNKEFEFTYIEYEDLIISFNQNKINIKSKKDIDNLLNFGSPETNIDEDTTIDKDTTKIDDDDDDDDEVDDEIDDDNSNTLQNIQQQNLPQFQQYQQPQYQQLPNYQLPQYQQYQQYQQPNYQHYLYNQQQETIIKQIIKNEMSLLIVQIKEYIDLQLNK